VSLDIGFNFRATFGLVTDGVNEVAVLGEAYPHTYSAGAVSIVGGWETGPSGTRDRDNAPTTPVELCGINFSSSTGDVFRIDLPFGGTYSVRFAFGDFNAPQPAEFELRDNTNVLVTYTGTTSGPGQFFDALNVEYSYGDWPAHNNPTVQTFSSTTLRLRVKNGAAGNNAIAHMRIASSGVRPWWQYATQQEIGGPY
jgi:hypothetical protein